ncbi:hypothetical protein IW262DRAFT_338134 [Armillaria fumosa]|nr:hypothetical protein IW262DRAFT_338134 [Armillaria fumosa]
MSKSGHGGTSLYCLVLLYSSILASQRDLQWDSKLFSSKEICLLCSFVSKFCTIHLKLKFMGINASGTTENLIDHQLEISLPTLALFKELLDKKEKLVEAVVRLNTVQGRGNIVELEEEDEED